MEILFPNFTFRPSDLPLNYILWFITQKNTFIFQLRRLQISQPSLQIIILFWSLADRLENHEECMGGLKNFSANGWASYQCYVNLIGKDCKAGNLYFVAVSDNFLLFVAAYPRGQNTGINKGAEQVPRRASLGQSWLAGRSRAEKRGDWVAGRLACWRRARSLGPLHLWLGSGAVRDLLLYSVSLIFCEKTGYISRSRAGARLSGQAAGRQMRRPIKLRGGDRARAGKSARAGTIHGLGLLSIARGCAAASPSRYIEVVGIKLEFRLQYAGASTVRGPDSWLDPAKVAHRPDPSNKVSTWRARAGACPAPLTARSGPMRSSLKSVMTIDD